MQTILKGSRKTVTIETKGPMTVIGETINPTRHKRLTTSFVDRQYGCVLRLADSQVESGADILDINVGVPGINEPAVMRASRHNYSGTRHRTALSRFQRP